MDIATLLNPESNTEEPNVRPRRRSSLAYRSVREASDDESSEFTPGPEDTMKRKKKGKEAKDAAKFEKGTTTGPVRFPPHETQDKELKRMHEKLQIFPKTGIAEYPRHIPYNSEKKAFQTSTGRHSFEVFQYTFKYKDTGKDWVVMWDYNIGLVRFTPFFKALGYIKTVPARAIAMSPGLKEICYSITGGSLAAQGYWIPFEAAKALAANFCWDIRFGLTPLFGDDFPGLCITPDDPAYTRYSIDPDIVDRCKEEVLSWRLSAGMTTPISGTPTPTLAVVQNDTKGRQTETKLRPNSATSHGTSSSSEGVDSTYSVQAYAPPKRTPKWTAINLSPASHAATSSSPSPDPWFSSVPTSPGAGADRFAIKRALEDAGNEADRSTMAYSDSALIEKRRKVVKFRAAEINVANILLDMSRTR